MADDKVALKLSTFSSNIVTSLNIPKFKNCNPYSERIPQPTLRAILKYANAKQNPSPVSSILTKKRYN